MKYTKELVNSVAKTIMDYNNLSGSPKTTFQLYLGVKDDPIMTGFNKETFSDLIEVMAHMGLVYGKEIGMPRLKPNLMTPGSKYPTVLHKVAAELNVSTIHADRLIKDYPKIIPGWIPVIKNLLKNTFNLKVNIITNISKTTNRGPLKKPRKKTTSVAMSTYMWESVRKEVLEYAEKNKDKSKREVYEDLNYKDKFSYRAFCINVETKDVFVVGRKKGTQRPKVLDEEWQKILIRIGEINPKNLLNKKELYHELQLEGKMAFSTFNLRYKSNRDNPARETDKVAGYAGLRKGLNAVSRFNVSNPIRQTVEIEEKYQQLVNDINRINFHRELTDRQLYFVLGEGFDGDVYDFMRVIDKLKESGVKMYLKRDPVNTVKQVADYVNFRINGYNVSNPLTKVYNQLLNSETSTLLTEEEFIKLYMLGKEAYQEDETYFNSINLKN